MIRRFLTLVLSAILASQAAGQSPRTSDPDATRKHRVQVVAVEKKKSVRPADQSKGSQKPKREGQ
jgi:hypothetical protein